jgi:hypothetical protein
MEQDTNNVQKQKQTFEDYLLLLSQEKHHVLIVHEDGRYFLRGGGELPPMNAAAFLAWMREGPYQHAFLFEEVVMVEEESRKRKGSIGSLALANHARYLLLAPQPSQEELKQVRKRWGSFIQLEDLRQAGGSSPQMKEERE